MPRATPVSTSPEAGERSDAELVEALRRGDERVFAGLVDEWSGVMLALALSRVGSRALAEEVVQEAWLTLLSGLETFEGRSSLRTWVLGIVMNLARSRARAERRAVPLPLGDEGPVVDPARFVPSTAARWPDHWAVPPAAWPDAAEDLLMGEARDVVLGAVSELPRAQREVLVLRDIKGLSAAETCDIVGITEGNQRVLLHRGRSRIRSALERYFGETETP